MGFEPVLALGGCRLGVGSPNTAGSGEISIKFFGVGVGLAGRNARHGLRPEAHVRHGLKPEARDPLSLSGRPGGVVACGGRLRWESPEGGTGWQECIQPRPWGLGWIGLL